MEQYAPEHADLAARDVVSRAIRSEIDAGRGIADPKEPDGPKDCVWLDMTGIDPDHMKAVLPQVVDTIAMYAGLDPTKDWIPVKPTAHYTMGGIPITTDGQVYRWENADRQIIDGLFAAGECSCVSVHGANRLGGNSLLDACLFGTRAGRTVALRILDNPAAVDDATDPDDDARMQEAVQDREHAIADLLQDSSAAPDDTTQNNMDEGAHDDNAYAIMSDLGSLLDGAIAVLCNKDTIRHAMEGVAALRERLHHVRTHMDTAAFNQELTAVWEAGNMLDLAQAVLDASLARHESRGSLKRTDWPKRDDEHFLMHSLTRITDDTQDDVTWQPVHIVDYQPTVRAY